MAHFAAMRGNFGWNCHSIPALSIVRNDAGNYAFLTNGNLLYTSGDAGGDFYDTAAKDSLVNFQMVMPGDGAMTATVDNFGIPQ